MDPVGAGATGVPRSKGPTLYDLPPGRSHVCETPGMNLTLLGTPSSRGSASALVLVMGTSRHGRCCDPIPRGESWLNRIAAMAALALGYVVAPIMAEAFLPLPGR